MLSEKEDELLQGLNELFVIDDKRFQIEFNFPEMRAAYAAKYGKELPWLELESALLKALNEDNSIQFTITPREPAREYFGGTTQWVELSAEYFSKKPTHVEEDPPRLPQRSEEESWPPENSNVSAP